MQYARPDQQTLTQADLFHNALMATRMEHNQFARLQQPKPLSSTEEQEYGYSEISLQGAARQCLQWLAPVLRDLSNNAAPLWLTLIDPPASLSNQWLRNADLDPERIMIVRSKPGMDVTKLCCDLLKLGGSHTVVSWLLPDSSTAPRLGRAAQAGHCRSLNIRLQAA
ncbi:SOS-induced cell division inhibitor SulA [Pseudomonas neustonica]|uniref:CDP-glycerol--UDP-pyrophosphoryl-N-acetylglucosaminyl-N-acetylmannosamine glycerophosphotransferase n=1 Tax=Pseudomonas neustonica TaxID=2487346 RepID=A0ABX9XGS6_9PSED|nr:MULTISPECIES: SOS-induced cell division inhibitor SulA [Pseudomonas]MAB23465.1 CDP-glycerol--UDP-pyrophosphoryl-N-acetylglucosaminyl-N-acetylmannosamine glycerophosphotransferase [Pseudomonadales bacterium]MBA6418766.1 CDP-glycerol--UDP-pyrophosphoryl-N-acetylglucosaminyl-N-acetylmannosamine glycerophosphotransferase [Pseudomonas sp. 5Ae-yellow]ROZ81955.1 CDP-glycerol--UDP-pyrophosphoryl-N-acetylglucosaminyl-N-acetylmannosamine glycerophosphotransferase [Pseudomonas sp. SSM44]ROZ83771.1 CDP-|tara:strand:- start:14071 stop:14571 length:501 start_codon:yes stop_codon:yes gene_type:complete